MAASAAVCASSRVTFCEHEKLATLRLLADGSLPPGGRCNPTSHENIPQLNCTVNVDHCQKAVYPPSATRMLPVMNEAASLARNTTLGAISSGAAQRFIGAS